MDAAGRMLRDLDRSLAGLEAADGLDDDLVGAFQRLMLIELDMQGPSIFAR